MDRFIRDQRVALYATAAAMTSFLVGNTLRGFDVPYMPVPFTLNVVGTASMSICLVYLVLRHRRDPFAITFLLCGVVLFFLSKASELPLLKAWIVDRFGRVAWDFYSSAVTDSLMDVGYCVVGLALCRLFITVSQRMNETADRERQLQSSEARFRGIFDHSNDAILLVRTAGLEIIDANARALVLFARSREELVGSSLTKLYRQSTPDAWLNSFGSTDRKEPCVVEIEYLPDGRDPIPTEVSVSPIDLFDQSCLVASVRDVTERKREETQRFELERKLLEAQRLESLGLLAGGVAHDFNNLLTGIMGHAGLALCSAPPGSEVHEFLKRIEKSSERAAELANQMLAYSGRGKFLNHSIDLNQLISELGTLLSASFPKKVEIRHELAAGLPRIVGDSTQIRQVLMNLLINAGEAIGDRGGVITISTRTLSDSNGETEPARSTSPAPRWIEISVADDGCGMDAATREKIFDPFFTTKFTGRGLGLAAVHGIVRGHGGSIFVDSEPGMGTRFSIQFPEAERSSTVVEVPQGPLTPQARFRPAVTGRAEPLTVLAVDDEEDVRELIRDVLEGCGYRVITAEDGSKAVEIFEQESDRISLVLLDLSMPRMDGLEAYSSLQLIRPDVPVIVSSGYSELEVSDRFQQRLLAGFIHKPYHPDALIEVVQRVLAA